MRLFNKKIKAYSPSRGLVKPIDQVNDKMFSTKALGDGFAVEPVNNIVVSPIEGNVTSIFATKHAISMKTKNGLEVLLHIGIDTVELNGAGFTIKVEDGDKVGPETVIAEVDVDFLKTKGKDTDVMVIFTNLDKKVLSIDTGQAVAGQEIGSIE